MGYNSETQKLLDILGSYRRQIIRSGKEHPTVVIDDIFDSINFVLRMADYNGMYASDAGKSYKWFSFFKKRNRNISLF